MDLNSSWCTWFLRKHTTRTWGGNNCDNVYFDFITRLLWFYWRNFDTLSTIFKIRILDVCHTICSDNSGLIIICLFVVPIVIVDVLVVIWFLVAGQVGVYLDFLLRVWSCWFGCILNRGFEFILGPRVLFRPIWIWTTVLVIKLWRLFDVRFSRFSVLVLVPIWKASSRLLGLVVLMMLANGSWMLSRYFVIVIISSSSIVDSGLSCRLDLILVSSSLTSLKNLWWDLSTFLILNNRFKFVAISRWLP